MSIWTDKSNKLRDGLRLKTEPIAYKKLDKESELDKIAGLTRWEQGSTFCQIPFLARVRGYTIGITDKAKMGNRCKGIHGLRSVSEDDMKQEAISLATTWMPSPEEAMKQQKDYPRIPAGEAIVVGPLAEATYEPDVVMIYGNPAQMMMIMSGMQKVRYERFQFFYIGEGACVDSLGQCYTTGKPSLAIPCYGERSLGQVADDEIVIALPPGEIDRAILGLKILRELPTSFKYPITPTGAIIDPTPILQQAYPKK